MFQVIQIIKKKKTVKTFIKGIKTKKTNNLVKVKQDFLPVHETLTLDP